MKIFIIIFLTIFLKINFTSANEFNWNKKVVTAKDNSSDYYLDNKSSRRIGNYKYQWILSNKLKDNDKIKSNIDYVTIDCKRNKLQIILVSDYSEHFGKGKIEDHRLLAQEDLKWSTAKPKTIMSYLIESSCNNVASSISSENNDNRNDDNTQSKPKNKTKKKYKEF
jgi:hypothetical protein